MPTDFLSKSQSNGQITDRHLAAMAAWRPSSSRRKRGVDTRSKAQTMTLTMSPRHGLKCLDAVVVIKTPFLNLTLCGYADRRSARRSRRIGYGARLCGGSAGFDGAQIFPSRGAGTAGEVRSFSYLREQLCTSFLTARSGLEGLCALLSKAPPGRLYRDAHASWAGLLFLRNSRQTHKQLLSCSKQLLASGRTAFLQSLSHHVQSSEAPYCRSSPVKGRAKLNPH